MAPRPPCLRGVFVLKEHKKVNPLQNFILCCVGSNYKTIIVPCKMGEVWVNWGRNDLAADFPELFGSIAERNDLSWTHKGEVQGIEEKHNIFPCSKGKENTWDILLWDNAWMVIIGSFILAFSCVNECLFNRPLWDHSWKENIIKSFCNKPMSYTSIVWQLQVLKLSVWHHCFGHKVWGHLSNLSFACSHFLSKQITEIGNSSASYKQNNNCTLFLFCKT